MKLMFLTCAAAMSLAAFAGAAMASPLPGPMKPEIPAVSTFAQSSQSRDFRRCMRAKYGPRYFARVPRAHRWHMSQACMA
jgi:hypothetical protein